MMFFSKRCFFLIGTLVLINISLIAQSGTIKSLSCADFNSYLNHSENIKLFDIREFAQFSQSRITNAQFADTKERLLVFLKNIDKADSIFIYCEIGKRSQQCANWLKGKGYKHIFQLKNGFEKWEAENYPIDNSVIEENQDEN